MKILPILPLLAIAVSGTLSVLAVDPAAPIAAGSSASATAKSRLSSAEKKFVKDAGEAQLAILHLTDLTRRPEGPGSEPLKEMNKKLGAELNVAWGELSTAAKGTELPKTDFSTGEKAMLDKLRKMEGDKFDKAFLKVFAKESKKAAQVFEMGEKSVKDAELKSFAQKWGPTLKNAQDAAETMDAEADKKK